MPTILVSGGAGFIGSHTVLELLATGHEVVVVDNLVNSSAESLNRVAHITGRTPVFHHIDLCDRLGLERVFAAQPVDAVIHFAGLKAVGESVAQPLRYYRNNLDSTINLLEVMQARGCRNLVFSSSATVYGDPERVPLTEVCALRTTNPYGHTKLVIEDMCRALVTSEKGWSIALLRYFNPVGAHESGLIGEDPQGVPNNLMPFLMQVAVGRREHLGIFGNDWPTPDGTGVRDYIHVVDLARGHLSALDVLRRDGRGFTVNLGTGRGYSVLEVVAAYQRASGRPVPYEIVARRSGDIAACYADPALAASLLGWRAQYGIERMCEDSWRWQSMNPDGFQTRG
jgi:UDP-glucose 4-epimerase